MNYKRVAEKDGKEVPWSDIVKGYEYEKGKFVVLNEKDFQRVDLEATQTVDIQDFVDLDEIDPMYFYKPYYLEPQKGGDKAYTLLREALADGKKVGIAKVIIKTRQYLAGVKALKHALVLELMHFAEELADAEKLNVPKKTELGKREKDMAEGAGQQHDVEMGSGEIQGRLPRRANGRDRGEGGIGRERDRGETEREKAIDQGHRSRGRAPGKPESAGRGKEEDVRQV